MSDWISVDEKLPNPSGQSSFTTDALIFNNRQQKIVIARRVFVSQYEWLWIEEETFIHQPIDVSHWMSLPEPPK